MMFKYCPNCGQKGSVSAENKTDYSCIACEQKFWNNPRGAAGAVLYRDGKFLSAKRGIEPDRGMYELPGGFMEYGEDPFDTCVRELREETGLELNRADLQLIAAYTPEYMPGVSSVDLIFLITEWRGDPKAADDVAELVWKPLSFFDDPVFVRSYPELAAKITTSIKK